MTTDRARRLVRALVACAALLATMASASERYEMHAAISPHVSTARWLAAADVHDTLSMAVVLHLQHADELQALIAAQQHPDSPDYHRWLTPQEFVERFAPTVQTYTAVLEWLRHAGFTVRPWPNRLRIDFSGPVVAVERAFRVRMARYLYRGHHALANDTPPWVPAELSTTIAMVRLHTFPLAEPLIRLTHAGVTINTMAPQDMYTAYNAQAVLDRGIDGAPSTVAVVGRSDFRDSDVMSFQQQFGVSVRRAVKVFPGDNPGIGATHGICQDIRDLSQRQQCIIGEEGEVLLDVEWAGVMAPGATVLVDISDLDIDSSLADVVNHHAEAKIITVSFGGCERLNRMALSFFAPLYAQAAAQGQTVLVSTGDSGADGCGDGGAAGVNVLSSDPNVTAIGGTSLDPAFDAQGNATGYVSEAVWNDVNGASGGGASTLVAKPAYQAIPGAPMDGARDQPDVALLASPNSAGYVVIFEGMLDVVGGTSVAAPTWAGIVALLNQAAGSDGLGAINHRLYPLGQREYAEHGVAVFHDVTTGNNSMHGVTGTSARTGFDLASGLGTPNIDLLVQAFAPTPCSGDCSGDGAVTVDELIVGVNIALGANGVAACTAMDTDHDGDVTINELIAATNRALNGC